MNISSVFRLGEPSGEEVEDLMGKLRRGETHFEVTPPLVAIDWDGNVVIF